MVVSSHPRKCKLANWCALCSGGSRSLCFGLLLKHFEDYERCEKFRPNVDMMGGGVVFGPVIGIVGFAGAPVKLELVVAFAVAQPVKSHIHGFGAFWLYFAIDDGICHGFVVGVTTVQSLSRVLIFMSKRCKIKLTLTTWARAGD